LSGFLKSLYVFFE